MIRINLVGEGKRPAAKKGGTGGRGLALPSVSLGGENAALMWLGGAAVVGLLVAAAWWLMLDRTIKANQAEIEIAQKKVDELQEILRQVEAFKRKEEELELKIEVITDLKNNQRGPVRILDEISRGLPDLLWLDRVEQKANEVVISGRSFSWNAVASFTESLDEVAEFQEPTVQDITQTGEVFTFTLKFIFEPLAVSSGAAESGAGAEAATEAGSKA